MGSRFAWWGPDLVYFCFLADSGFPPALHPSLHVPGSEGFAEFFKELNFGSLVGVSSWDPQRLLVQTAVEILGHTQRTRPLGEGFR